MIETSGFGVGEEVKIAGLVLVSGIVAALVGLALVALGVL